MAATQVWSCGGGTQSAAIAALICQRRIERPDLAIMVDTNREKTGTWKYVNEVLRPALLAVQVELEIIDRSKYATVDLYSVNGDSLLMPGFTTQGGAIGKLPTWCSNEWKARPIERFLRERGVEQAEIWLGISVDEANRIRAPRRPWQTHRYPLIFDVRMRRADCVALVEAMGWPTPPRSSCWMCPNMADREWAEMKRDWPADFAAAIAIEIEIQATDPHFFLHQSCQPLSGVDFETYQGGLFETGCASGHCFV